MKNKIEQDTNRKFWDEVANVHYEHYDLERLRNGGGNLYQHELDELGDISGLDVLHPMCHIGSDTLSLARLGAKVTGADFSAESIRFAKKLSGELKLSADFVHSNVYGLKSAIDRQFDLVYTGKGVLCWLPDLDEWAKVLAGMLRHDGRLYLMESHPFGVVFDDEADTLKFRYRYFHDPKPYFWDDDCPDYASDYIPQSPTYEWQWAMGDIINAIAKAGLRVEFLHEFNGTFYKALPIMKETARQWWTIPDFEDIIPLSFTLMARKG